MSFSATIGLEIHCQLRTKTKLFCGCPTEPNAPPNQNTCPVCLGHPGVLPFLNRAAVELGIRVGLSLGSRISPQLRFDRKQYFYPDLSKQFQTSQFFSPLFRGGDLTFRTRGRERLVRVSEAHLEEDAARLGHAGEESYVDFNRAGMPLLEIVTEPDLRNGEGAEELLRSLQLLVRSIGASDANMELAQLRCDANVSVAPRGGPLGVRVEVKNLNSPRFVRMAIEHEIERQISVIESGGTVLRETRLWNENRSRTEGMRSKELAHDYRYMPEPDLPVVTIPEPLVEELRQDLPELPWEKLHRFTEKWGLPPGVAHQLVAEPDLAFFFDRCVAAGAPARPAANWMLNQMKALETRASSALSELGLVPEDVAALINLVEEEFISSATGRKLLPELSSMDVPVRDHVINEGLEQISDLRRLQTWVDEVVEGEPQGVQDLRAGEAKAFSYLMGKVLQKSQGRANVRIVRDLLHDVSGTERVVVLGMGGAIGGERDQEGVVSPSAGGGLAGLVSSFSTGSRRLELLPVTNELSENISVDHWLALWENLNKVFETTDAKGVVVSHGLDTLSYTAPLMRWLLPDCPLPVVFTGSVCSPDEENSDAAPNLGKAIEMADGGVPPGVWVSIGPLTAPALNLQMVDVTKNPFVARNLPPAGSDEFKALASGHWDTVRVEVSNLRKAMKRTLLLRVHPGMNTGWITSALDRGVEFLLLELYDTGTGNVRRDAEDSLLSVLRRFGECGGSCFCTSQLGVPVDLSRYASSRDLWDAGVIPLGRLVTESAFTKLVAAQLLEDDAEGVRRRMILEDFAL